MRIGPLDTTDKVVIIAEIGNNHEGSLELAVDLLHLAAQNGVDAVKFQAIKPARLVASSDRNRIAQLSRFCLDERAFERLKREADACDVVFLCTPFYPEIVEFLDTLVPAFKIASGDNNYDALLNAVAATGKPVLLSTGLSDIERIRVAVERLRSTWHACETGGDIALLHCVSSYPTPMEEAHLGRIRWLRSNFACEVGYSDHVIGVDAAVLSVGVGARIVEKHFTCDHNYSDYRDHQLSADPEEMRILVQRIREAERFMGAVNGAMQTCEMENCQTLSRSIVASRNLRAGHVITYEDLDWLRPARGLMPGQENLLLGKRLKVTVTRGELLTTDLVED